MRRLFSHRRPLLATIGYVTILVTSSASAQHRTSVPSTEPQAASAPSTDPQAASAQPAPLAMTMIRPASVGVSEAASDLPAPKADAADDSIVVTVPLRTLPSRPDSAGSSQQDGAIQRSAPDVMVAPIASFDGLSSQDNFNAFGGRVYPPDTNGDVGPNHYVQATNLLVRVYDKTGTAVTAPVKMSSRLGSIGGLCATNNNGDPMVVYDSIADRGL